MSITSCLLLGVEMLKPALTAMELLFPRTRVATLSSALDGISLEFGFGDTSRVVLGANLVVETRVGAGGIEAAFSDVGALGIVRGSAWSTTGLGVGSAACRGAAGGDISKS